MCLKQLFLGATKFEGAQKKFGGALPRMHPPWLRAWFYCLGFACFLFVNCVVVFLLLEVFFCFARTVRHIPRTTSGEQWNSNAIFLQIWSQEFRPSSTCKKTLQAIVDIAIRERVM